MNDVSKRGRRAPFLFVILLVAIASGCAICREDQVVHSPAPSEKIVASTFVRDCGATTNYATWVTLHREDDKFNRSEDLVFVADGEHHVELKWSDDSHLAVSCPSCIDSQIFNEVVIKRKGTHFLQFSLISTAVVFLAES